MTSTTALSPDPAHRRAHRAVLDHVLALVADAPWADGLVLRGSAVMSAWVGAAAREPADLDWVVQGGQIARADPLDPYPFLDDLLPVRLWPEVAHGGGVYEFWEMEDLDTGGLRAHLAPEGLHWIRAGEGERLGGPPFGDLVARLRRRPEVAPGLRVDAQGVWEDENWTYLGEDAAGIRLVLPWRAEGGPSGELRLDFALDERMPEAPRWAAIPRADGRSRAVVRAAGPGLCLAWKLRWLAADACAGGGLVKAKDLYDAVVLAEHPRTRLTSRLLRRVPAQGGGRGAPGRETVLDWRLDEGDGEAFGLADGAAWVARLAGALEGRGLTAERAEGSGAAEVLRVRTRP
ncbi:hypothetical protein [Streptacidiphilus jiangxiensis]|uniref:Nucleotidyl transferase AbiEii toxin, Type IV TA system n=1 Tax=Streptacidiphilus jiangxiensis TaxID=235985 RepID=A0A1H7IGE2_STRJI|nr:hypothetical protein [Streptacidiphilus jiangxiensis]SEK59695.1 hypothetical protein SAMN05414137_102581 [Streptacidiphilus jiangxiensis]